MTDTTVLHLVSQMLLVGLKVCGPILVTTLVVGVAISVLQAATQVQEMTLTFVPKIIAVGAVVAFLGPWMIHTMVDFTSRLFTDLARFAH